MQKIRKASLLFSAIAILVFFVGLFLENFFLLKAGGVSAAFFFSFGIGAIKKLNGYQYTSWILTAVIAALIYPSGFLNWGPIDLQHPWLILGVVQLVMFGMGVQMRLEDFNGLATSGKGVIVGLLSQFSIMPLIGFMITGLFDFEPEIAAGVILIGACSGGLASNVMAYIAKANLMLSITVTAIATLVAPLMTPLLMKLLAGTFIEIDFSGMMMQIIKIVIVPIGAALLCDFLRKKASQKHKKIVYGIGILGMVWLIVLVLGGWNYFNINFSGTVLSYIEIVSFLLAAIIVGVLYFFLTEKYKRLDDFMPYLSMFGIVYFTAVTTAAGREALLRIGLLLFLAAILHNTAGYFLGYWFSRALKLDQQSARSLAFEVGMQNGGMASGIAGTMGKLGTLGLAAAVFSPWMNISGSILANYWKQKMPKKSQKKSLEKPEEVTNAPAP